MKKKILLASTALLFFGCNADVEPKVKEVYVEVPPKCEGCVKQKEKPKKVKVNPCAYNTKMVYYKDKCNCAYSFPVTVREKSDCNKGNR